MCSLFKSRERREEEGLPVLFHGFSACPQQWDLISPLLAKRGFDVLMPLNPGHGNLEESRTALSMSTTDATERR